MKKIVLITTKGCEGCSNMRDNIKEALTKIDINNEIIFSIKSFENLTKNTKKKYIIRDFPTVMFFAGENLVFKYSGCMPVIVIVHWIKIYFRMKLAKVHKK